MVQLYFSLAKAQSTQRVYRLYAGIYIDFVINLCAFARVNRRPARMLPFMLGNPGLNYSDGGCRIKS
jgi:hypothetical protein